MKLTDDRGETVTLDLSRDELTVLAGGLLTALDLPLITGKGLVRT